jgi:predicted  nucleic acid-binding Zn-ribbon protein
VNAGEQLLRHARVVAKVRSLIGELEQLETALSGDARMDGARQRHDQALAAQREGAARVRDREHEAEAKRIRLRERSRELMSGRINNPSELTKLSTEVDHLRERLSAEEEEELRLMEEQEDLDAALTAAEADLERIQAEFEAASPALRSQLEAVRQRLVETEAERDAVWAEIPPDHQAAAKRIRVQPPVAEVRGNQCSECHMTVTTIALQRLRRGELVTCDTCGRILVV